MKIRLTETQIKMLSEKVQNPMQAYSSDQETAATINRMNKVKAVAQDLKKTLGIDPNASVSENDNAVEQQPVRLELTDHIDELLKDVYGFTYFKDYSKPGYTKYADTMFPEKVHGQNVPFYPKLSPEQQASYDKKLGKEMEMLKSGDENQLNQLFIKLIRRKNSLSELDEPYNNSIPTPGLNENNFADSEIFRIIAEAEKPRLTKKEFIDYIKTKK